MLFNGWTLYPDAGELTTNCLFSTWLAGFSVIISRCTPAVSKSTKNPIPTPEKMGEAAKLASDDAELFRDLVPALSGFMSPQIVVQAPSGGFQTVELSLSLSGL